MKQKIVRKYIFNRKLLSDLIHENMMVQQDLALAVGISQSQISKILRGDVQNPSAEKIHVLANYFQVEDKEFFTLNPNWQDKQDGTTNKDHGLTKSDTPKEDEQSSNTSPVSNIVHNRERKVLIKIAAVANDEEMDNETKLKMIKILLD